MPTRSSTKAENRPVDTNQLAKAVVDEATGNSEAVLTEDGKNAAAVALGRRGGLKGGKARAKKLTKKKRSEIAQKAALARWGRSKASGSKKSRKTKS